MTGKGALVLGGIIVAAGYALTHVNKGQALAALPLLPAGQAHAPHAMASDQCNQWGCDGVTKHCAEAAGYYPGGDAPDWTMTPEAGSGG